MVDGYCFILMDLCDNVRSIGRGFRTAVFIVIRVVKDIIIGRDLLADLGLDLHYSTSQFVWNGITVDMVPSGYLTQEKISNLAKTWNSQRKPTRKIDPKVKSATEENAKKTSAWTVETEVNQTANLDRIKTAIEALPVQPYKMSQ